MEIKELLQNRILEITDAKSEKQDFTDKTAKMLGKPYKQMASLMKGWSTSQIRDRYLEVQKASNPPAMWWWKRENIWKKNPAQPNQSSTA